MNIQNLVLDINKKPFQTITANKGEVGKETEMIIEYL